MHASMYNTDGMDDYNPFGSSDHELFNYILFTRRGYLPPPISHLLARFLELSLYFIEIGHIRSKLLWCH